MAGPSRWWGGVDGDNPFFDAKATGGLFIEWADRCSMMDLGADLDFWVVGCGVSFFLVCFLLTRSWSWIVVKSWCSQQRFKQQRLRSEPTVPYILIVLIFEVDYAQNPVTSEAGSSSSLLQDSHPVSGHRAFENFSQWPVWSLWWHFLFAGKRNRNPRLPRFREAAHFSVRWRLGHDGSMNWGNPISALVRGIPSLLPDLCMPEKPRHSVASNVPRHI